MITVTNSFLPPLEGYFAKVHDIWQTQQFTNNGVNVKLLQAELGKRLKVRNLSLVSNGTIALQLALKVFGIKGEVVTTPFSYVATAASIAWEGCIPVFADISPDTLCIDPQQIEQAISPRTEAIMATHVYGYPCDVDAIEQIATKHGLKVIYDAAHCFGVRFRKKSLCNYGDAATLSFHATKLFHTGEGGGIVCQDKSIFKRLEFMKKFGHFGEERYELLGINAKMSELHAALGLCVLPHVDAIIESRKKCSQLYDSLLKSSALQRPHHSKELDYNYAYYPVIFPSTKLMKRASLLLKKNGIVARRYFYPSLNTLDYLLPGVLTSCPVSESIASRVLALPLSHSILEQDIQRIAQLVRQVVG